MSKALVKDVTQRPVLTRRELLGILPINQSTLWRWIRAQKFPRPINPEQGKLLWRKADVEAWMGQSL
jgi:prophage regulatory protein